MAAAKSLIASDVKVTPREQMYIDALTAFYAEASADYQRAPDTYTVKMKALHEAYPNDVEAAAFYALAEIASVAPGDTSLTHERTALQCSYHYSRQTRSIRGWRTTSFTRANAETGAAGTGCSAGVREDRAVVAARSTHAGAHLCTAGDVAPRHSVEPCIRGGVGSRGCGGRTGRCASDARGRVPGLRLSAGG